MYKSFYIGNMRFHIRRYGSKHNSALVTDWVGVSLKSVIRLQQIVPEQTGMLLEFAPMAQQVFSNWVVETY